MGDSIDYVGYASRRFITGYVGLEGRRPIRVLFDRFMTTLHRDLKEGHGTDIGLPHCWYEQGDRRSSMRCRTCSATVGGSNRDAPSRGAPF